MSSTISTISTIQLRVTCGKRPRLLHVRASPPAHLSAARARCPTCASVCCTAVRRITARDVNFSVLDKLAYVFLIPASCAVWWHCVHVIPHRVIKYLYAKISGILDTHPVKLPNTAVRASK